jgi:hypothetical protein
MIQNRRGQSPQDTRGDIVDPGNKRSGHGDGGELKALGEGLWEVATAPLGTLAAIARF